jgi:hypothetical protein
MRVKEGAGAKDHEEYRESVRLKVHQGDGGVRRGVERFQDIILKVPTRDRIEPRTTLFVGSSLTGLGNKDSHPSCVCIVQISQSDRPITEWDVLGKIDNQVGTIGNPERKGVDKF